MKVLEIAGHNLASLKGEFRIPLDQAPFSRDGLFAIRGVTGSGKSTLIDAICLALYDDTPRFAGKGGAEIGLADQKDRLKATDPRSILHRGAAQGWAEVIFRGVDGARWRARWSVARARKKADGKFHAQEMELENLDTGERPSGTRTEVLEHIQKKVGLTFEQFKRSALLAQGEFAAFVKAGEEARANLLEAMTGTDIYARLSIAAQKRSAQEDQKLKNFYIQRDALGLMSVEGRQEKEIQVSDLEKQLHQQEQEQAKILHGLGWHERNTAMERQCTEATLSLSSAETTLGNAEVRHLQLNQVERAQPLRTLHGSLGQARDHHASLVGQISERQIALPKAEGDRTNLEKAFLDKQEALQVVMEAIAAAKPDLDAARELDTKVEGSASRSKNLCEEATLLEEAAKAAEGMKNATERTAMDQAERLTRIEAELKDSTSVQALAKSWTRVEKDLDDFAKAAINLHQAEKDLGAVRTTLKKHQDDRGSIQGSIEERASERSGLRVALDELAKGMAEEPREVLDAERNAHQVTVNGLRLADGILMRLHPLLIQHADAEAEARAQVTAREHAKTDKEEAQRSLSALEGGLKEARAALERAQAALSLEERRAELLNGEPCPLCGSLDHPWAGGSPLIGLLEAQAKQVTELEGRKSDLEQGSAEARTRIIEADKAESKALKQAKAYIVEIQKADEAWREVRSRVKGLPEDAHASHTHTVVGDSILDQEEALASISKREGALLDLEKQAELLRRKEREADKERLEFEAKLRLVDGEIRSLGVKEAEHAKDSTNLESRMRGLRTDLDTVLDRDAMAELDRDPQSLGARLGAAVAKRLASEAAHAELVQKLVEVAKTLEGQRATAIEKRASATIGRGKREKAAKELEDLREQRKGFFGGRGVIEVEQGLEVQRKNSDEALEGAREEFQTADRALGEQKHAIATLQEQSERAKNAEHSAREAFDEAMARQWEGDLGDLEGCLAWTLEQIQAERAALQTLETATHSAWAVLEEHRKALEEHMASERPALAKVELDAVAAALKEALDGLNRAMGGLQADLVRDDLAKRNDEALALAIQGQEERTRLWNEMNTLVGSSDGKKFRTFAQSLTLEALLVFANEQLSRLTPRYRLHRVPNCELEIQVIDQDMGDEIRALNSLSGGETFLVSLALALGLSSLSASDTPIESLFIDEGFGTLDSETLETALSVLDELQSQGRQVGIISHVDGLATHIPVQISVEKLGGGRSKVVLPSLGRVG